MDMDMKIKDRKKQIRIITVLGACLLLAVIYLSGLIYYSSHFLPSTYINEVDVSNRNVSEANEALAAVDPVFTVTGRSADAGQTEEKIDLKKLDPSISYDSSSLLKAQNSPLWFTVLFGRKDLKCDHLSGTYDPQKLTELVKGLNCTDPEKTVMPQDAKLDIKDGNVVIVDAVEGNYVDPDTVIEKFQAAVDSCLAGEGEAVLDLTPYYEVPKSSEDLQLSSLKEEMQKVLDKTVYIDIDSSQEKELQGTELCDLLEVEEDQIVVDEENLSTFIADLCSRYDVSSSEYIDRSSLKTDLLGSLTSKEDETVSVNWVYERAEGLIEVDISDQMLYYYENDVLILSSPIVSGNPDITDETIHGHYTVQRMSRNTQLMGRDYLEDVAYWIGFDETGRVYGIHDASWRDAFGGDIWLTDPSRGCVNMPTDKVAQLYSYIDIGTEVYVHD